MRRETTRPNRAPSTTHNYLFVSDLHLSEGFDPLTGKISRNEDFFYDDAFARFIVYHASLTKDLAADPAFQKPWKLYLNGDFLEFLQVTSLPSEDDPINQNPKVEFTPNVKRFGLGTSEPESVWKLRKIVEGHPLVFQALGWFLAHPNNEIVILKGNHDIEVFWPKVKSSILEHIAHQYHRWYRSATKGHLPESPLPLNGHPELLPAEFKERIHFPEWFAIEHPLFYIEHGNQYDPDNAFVNFRNPILSDKPHLIELPGGSFFVRYFFNQVEQLHPFADNLRPISRYINWVFNQRAADLARMILKQPGSIYQAVTKLLSKRGKIDGIKKINIKREKSQIKTEHLDTNLMSVLGPGQLQMLNELRFWAQNKASDRNRRSITSIVLNFICRFIAMLLALWGLREFFVGNFIQAFIFLLLWVAIYGIRLLLLNQSEDADHYVDLPGVARKIRFILNLGHRNRNTSVQFHIFGHDHKAAVEEISKPDSKLPFRQWYINTGSWLPSFNELDRITRNDAQLAFLRLIPDREDFDQAVPELLEWLPTENRPAKVRLFSQNPTE